jgi:signal transduction histidine kinase
MEPESEYSQEQQSLEQLRQHCAWLRSQSALSSEQIHRLAAGEEEEISKLAEIKARRETQLRSIWHTARGDVQVIMGNIDMLSECIPDEKQSLIQSIDQRASSLQQLCEELKSLTRRHQSDKPKHGQDKEIVNLVYLVQQECDFQAIDARRNNVRIHIESSSHEELYVIANRIRIKRVIRELIENALRYVDDGSGTIGIALEADDDTVWLRFKDNGQGIKEKDKEHIFETSFYDLKQGRTGHGLALVRHIIREQHDGSIHVESTEGVGTTFHISLPRSAPPADVQHVVVPVKLKSGLTEREYEYNPMLSIQLGRAYAYEAKGPDGESCWIKMFSEDDTVQYERLSHELRLFAGGKGYAPLSHRSLIRMIDRGQRQDRETGKLLRFIVFTSAPGESLQLILETKPQMELAWALSIARHLAELLAYLHDQGVIIRTLSPAAIYTDNEKQQTTLIDLGAARYEQDLEQLREPPDKDNIYASPEWINGTVPGRRSDIYVFGLLLFELFTGQQPFDTALDHMSMQPPSLHELRDHIPDALEHIVQCCLQKWPTDRYDHTGALLEALHAISIPSK